MNNPSLRKRAEEMAGEFAVMGRQQAYIQLTKAIEKALHEAYLEGRNETIKECNGCYLCLEARKFNPAK